MTSHSDYKERWQRVTHPLSWADRFLRKQEVRKFLGIVPNPKPENALSVYVTGNGMQMLYYLGVKIPRVTQTIVWQGCEEFSLEGGCNVLAECLVPMLKNEEEFVMLPMSRGLQLYGVDLPLAIVHSSIYHGMWKVTFMAHAYVKPVK